MKNLNLRVLETPEWREHRNSDLEKVIKEGLEKPKQYQRSLVFLVNRARSESTFPVHVTFSKLLETIRNTREDSRDRSKDVFEWSLLKDVGEIERERETKQEIV